MSINHRPFRRLFIANRGEIAARIARTATRMGKVCLCAYTETDRKSPHLRTFERAIRVENYLDREGLVAAVVGAGAEALHPGYGFLAEDARFARMVTEAGLVWVGPPPEAIEAMGSKAPARLHMAARGVPVLPGYDGEDQRPEALLTAGRALGFPLMVKASAGGGGKGMSVVRSELELEAAIASAQRLGAAAFGDARILLERFVERPRHVEVQVLGDQYGRVIHLWERECSVQRRHQKVIEEAPSPAFVGREEARQRLLADAVEAARSVGYENAGTVEFIVDSQGQHYFLEMNTRLQVEHPVTEAITGLDLVEWQLRVAAGEALPFVEVPARGWAMEARVYAEDPSRDYLPSAGRLLAFSLQCPVEGRIDAGFEQGLELSSQYDPMLAKVIAFGEDRDMARWRLSNALSASRVAGVACNIPQLVEILEDEEFAAGNLHTALIESRNLLGGGGRAERERDALMVVGLVQSLRDAGKNPVLPGIRPAWRNNPWPEPPLRLGLGTEVVRLQIAGSGREWRLGGPFVLPVADLPAGEPDPLFPTSVSVEVLEQQGSEQEGRISFLVKSDQERRVDAGWIQVGEVVHVLLPRAAVVVRQLPTFDVPDAEGAQGGTVAPMSGRVVRIAVLAGQLVEAGDVLVVVEAMKMEQAVRAGEKARVEAVLVEVGQQVEAGQALVRLSAGEEAAG